MRKTLIAAALCATTALPAAALDLDAMSDADKEAFGAAVRSYLLENPEVLMEAIGVLENRDQAAREAADLELVAKHSADLFDAGDWESGNPEGDLTLVEFVDYKCGYCRRAYEDVNQLVEQDGNIRFIVKEFPILGPQSMIASQFALAVREVAGDEAYEAVHDELMTLPTEFTMEVLAEVAEGQDLDMEAIEAAMTSDTVADKIKENHALGQAMQISGTPTFTFGDQLLRGYLPLDALEDIAEDLRAEG